MTPPKVLVLGGGYVSIYLCRAIKPVIEAGKVDVTVVNRENYQVFHGFVGEMLTGRVSPSHILSPARRMFPPARVHVGEIQKINLGARFVTTARSIDGARVELPFDQLVIALGSVDRAEAYPGLAEHAFKLKTYEDVLRLRNHIISMFELADVERDEEERRRLLTFFIAGGGYAGTEVAGELSDLARRLTKREYKHVNLDEVRVVLVHPGPTILPEMQGAEGHPKLVEYAERRMRELGVEVQTNTKVAAVTPNHVDLSNGDRVPTRTVISAVGTKPPPVVASLPLEKDERGRLVTDEYCQVPGHEGVIWAAGDNAAVPLPFKKGQTCPPVAIYAMYAGKRIGKNIALGVEGRKAKKLRFLGIGQGASVGRRSAVAELKGIELTGLPACLIWRLLLTYYFPS